MKTVGRFSFMLIALFYLQGCEAATGSKTNIFGGIAVISIIVCYIIGKYKEEHRKPFGFSGILSVGSFIVFTVLGIISYRGDKEENNLLRESSLIKDCLSQTIYNDKKPPTLSSDYKIERPCLILTFKEQKQEKKMTSITPSEDGRINKDFLDKLNTVIIVYNYPHHTITYSYGRSNNGTQSGTSFAAKIFYYDAKNRKCIGVEETDPADMPQNISRGSNADRYPNAMDLIKWRLSRPAQPLSLHRTEVQTQRISDYQL